MADWMQIVGTISAVSSLAILIWQVYKQMLADCKHDPHALTDIQKADELHRKISEIHNVISRRTSRDSHDEVSGL
jgi:dihydrodipicolinate synthase/N-acetylneuraminate lyase